MMQSDEKRLNTYGCTENINLTGDDWNKRWERNQIGFHQKRINPNLLKHEEKFLEQETRIFVPLCGKSLDLLYLADKGHDVVGCEISEIAIKEFYDENAIQYKTYIHPSKQFTVFEGIDKKVTLFQGDFFKLDCGVTEKFSAIWDRASFVAINPNQREDYVRLMASIMTSDARYLLNTFAIIGEKYYGPPHSVSDEDFEKCFSPYFNASHLETYRSEKPIPNSPAVDFTFVTNRMLTLK